MTEKQTCQMCKNDRFAEEMHRCSYCSLEACENCLDVVPYGGDVQFCRGGDCELEYLRNHYNDLRDEVEGVMRMLNPIHSSMNVATLKDGGIEGVCDVTVLIWRSHLAIAIEALRRRLDNE